MSDLAGLLSGGEHAMFHGKPAAAVSALEQAVVAAQAEGRTAELGRAAWLLGAALGAEGRYGAALTVLAPLVEAGRGSSGTEERRAVAALAGSTMASVQRQLGRHQVARDADEEALELSGGRGEPGFDALLGLASDAVGLEDPEGAAARLGEAEALLPGRDEEWWRQRVRLRWVRAELALLEGEVEDAAALAAEAVERAQAASAPRHVAKGSLIQGLAEVSAGSDDAPSTLRRAATLAESLGCVPLVWPARALLGALVAEQDPVESDRSLGAARSAVLAIAGDLPAGVRADWLARPDVDALLGG